MSNGQRYEASGWHPSGSAYSIVRDMRFACPGNYLSDRGCAQRPDWVVIYVTNESGLPGLGKTHLITACYRHLHRIVSHATDCRPVGGITVTKYDGI